MKLYQIIMEVPDNFNPDEMELRASCDKEIKISSEGFIGPECISVGPQEIPSDIGLGSMMGGLFGAMMGSGVPSEGIAPDKPIEDAEFTDVPKGEKE